MAEELNSDVLGVVADFLTPVEAFQLAPCIRLSYMADRLAAINKLDEADKYDAFYEMFEDRHKLGLLFPDMVKTLPDEFPWDGLIHTCIRMDELDKLSWVLHNKQHLPLVKTLSEKSFKTFANILNVHTTNQAYTANNEMTWHKFCIALVDASPDPAKLWEEMLAYVIESRAPQHWLRWLVDAARHGRFAYLDATHFNNALLCRLLKTTEGINLARKKQVLDMFTKPVLADDYKPLLQTVLENADIDGCRELFIRLRARPDTDQRRYIKEQMESRPQMKLISTFFAYVETHGMDDALGVYCAQWDKQRRRDVKAVGVRRQEAMRQSKRKIAAIEAKYQKDLHRAREECDNLLNAIDSDSRACKRRASDDFQTLSRVLRVPF